MTKNIRLLMPLKNQPTHENQFFPFTKVQLSHFRVELKKAGGFHELMFQKKALIRRLGMKYINQYLNIERYKEKYLSGVYQPLQPFYDTELPFVFWSEMYESLLRFEFEG